MESNLECVKKGYYPCNVGCHHYGGRGRYLVILTGASLAIDTLNNFQVIIVRVPITA